MIKVLQINDYELTKKFFADKNIPFGPFNFCSVAFDEDKKIGECFYEYKGNCVIIKDIFPKNDLLLVDGILRSVFFVASNKGVEEATFLNEELTEIFEKIDFLLDKDKKTLKLKKIFESCAGCKR